MFRILFFCLVTLSSVLPTLAGSNEEGLAFLAENKEKEGVIELPSGLQYKVLTNGTGTEHPLVSTPCLCHYEGKLIDGSVFDSSYERGSPTTFAPNQVIKGWTECMQLMVEGDKWELYIPSDLAYGDRGSPPKIPGGSVLIFQMEIVKINGETRLALKCNVETGELCNDKELQYIEKAKAWKDVAKGPAELVRLEKMVKENLDSVKPSLVQWIRNRIFLLKQMYPSESSKEEEEL